MNGVEVTTRLRRAFDRGRTRSSHWRIQQLRGLEAMMVEREAEFLDALRADLGKPPFEAWAGEVGSVAEEARHAVKHLARWMRPQKVRTPLVNQPGSSRLYREPLGVTLIVGPFNYPIQLLLSPLVGALAAGNCAVLKPSELTEQSAAALARWVPDYLDPECVAVVQGGVAETQELLAQPFDHIFYTGSPRVGRIVMAAAAQNLTPVTLELGGKSPCIVDRQVKVELAARRIAWGKWFNAGQTCVAVDYVLAHADVHEQLIQAIGEQVATFYGDDPLRSPDLASIVSRRHLERLQELVAGQEVVLGGQTDAEALRMAPTLLRNPIPEAPVMEEEIFGPVLPVLSVPDIDTAVSFVNRRPCPLALYVFSEDRAVQRSVIERTRSGGACVNEVMSHLRVPDLPFGGLGNSGMGAYHGRDSFETFSHRRGVFQKTTKVDPSMRYPPYSDKKLRIAKKLM